MHGARNPIVEPVRTSLNVIPVPGGPVVDSRALDGGMKKLCWLEASRQESCQYSQYKLGVSVISVARHRYLMVQ